MILSDILEHGAQRWAERPAVADAETSLTYAQLREQALRIGAWLRAQGAQAGDRVIVQLSNCARFVSAHFATQSIGAVSTPLDPNLPAAQLASIIARTEPAIVLSDHSPWEEIFSAPPLAEPVRRDSSELAAIMFTTGTTGQPKGVMLTHANIFTALENIIRFVGYTEADREVITLPLSHNFGLGHVYCNLLSGGAVYLAPGLARVGKVLSAIRDFEATGFPTTPLGVALLLDRYGEAFIERAQSLRFMVVNSAPLPPERAAQLQAALPNLNILVYYGLTEASRSTFISLTREGPAHYGSVGPAMHGVDLRLDANGQVLISGPTVTPGYWRDPVLTADRLPNGVLQTGDLGELDARGYLRIIGRMDDLINFGGYKINPRDIERVLEQHPEVREAAVVGNDAGVRAYYVSGQELDADALTRHCRASLPVHETPTRFIRRAILPRTDSGKLQRQALIAE